MTFKPQLLSNEEVDINSIQFPIMKSTKYDGVRVEITNKGLFGRSMKPIGNRDLDEVFKEGYSKLPDNVIIEGEIYHYGKPCREIAGICNSSKEKKDLHGFLILAFDYFNLDEPSMPWDERNKELKITLAKTFSSQVTYVGHDELINKRELLDAYDEVMAKGYEGLVLMNPKGLYKKGRLSNRMNIGYKLKPVRTDDLEIVDVLERMENLNESLTNELGHSYKRNTKDDKKPTGIASALVCKMPNGNTTKVTLTGTEDDRREIWAHRDYYKGRVAEVKSMDYGVKDKPRFPRLIRIKEKVER